MGSGPSALPSFLGTWHFSWSWGESNPRPSGGDRPCYDHSRVRGSRCPTAGSVDLLTEVHGSSFRTVSGLPRRQPAFRRSSSASVAGLRWIGPVRPCGSRWLSTHLDQAATANCWLAVVVGAPFSESEQLGSHARPAKLM